jgi:hypothetical protein
MSRKFPRIALAACVAAGVLLVGPSGHAALTSRRFEMPSGNISCHLPKGAPLRCDIYSGLNPEPEKECELDWVGLLLSRRGKARPNCAGDTVGSAEKTLEYGEKWKRGGRTCRSKESGLHCWNEGGYHFKLSRDKWRRWHQG